MNTSHHSVKPLLLALGLAFGLAACGGDDKAPAAGASPNNASGAAVQSGELAEKQEVVVNNGSEVESLDPHKVSGVPESNIIRQMLVGLTTTDNDGNTIGGMAEKWESADNKVWTFHLRDAKWSNGDPVTAEDFVYSMRRLTDPATASPYATYFADSKVANAQEIVDGKAKPDTLGVKAIDTKTLEITLTEPVPYFPHTLIHTSAKPVHRVTVEKFGEKWVQPENFVGNGPYKLKSWVVNDKIVLERNSAYYDDANTKINQATFLAITSDTTTVSRYQAGEIDVTSDAIPAEQFKSLQEQLGSQMKVSPKLCTYYYDFNVTQAPFDNPKVRKALALSLDRELFADKILAQGQKAAYQFTPVFTQGLGKPFEPEWKAWDKAKRIEEAKKLLTEAGFSESNPLKFELLYNTNESHKKLAVAASALWKESLGMVDVTLTNQEWKTYLDTRRQGKYQVSRGGWCADYNEPSTFLNMLKTGNSSNYGKFSNAEFDGLVAQTLAAGVTDEQRAELYHQAEAILDREAAAIFVYQYVSPRLVKPYVAGYSEKDPTSNYQVKNWSILKH